MMFLFLKLVIVVYSVVQDVCRECLAAHAVATAIVGTSANDIQFRVG
jgi:hypothetical protein